MERREELRYGVGYVKATAAAGLAMNRQIFRMSSGMYAATRQIVFFWMLFGEIEQDQWLYFHTLSMLYLFGGVSI